MSADHGISVKEAEGGTCVKDPKDVRFPTADEILELMEDAVPLAQKEAARNKMEFETWMIADALGRVCPELALCDQRALEQLVEQVWDSINDG